MRDYADSASNANYFLQDINRRELIKQEKVYDSLNSKLRRAMQKHEESGNEIFRLQNLIAAQQRIMRGA